MNDKTRNISNQIVLRHNRLRVFVARLALPYIRKNKSNSNSFDSTSLKICLFRSHFNKHVTFTYANQGETAVNCTIINDFLRLYSLRSSKVKRANL